MTATAPDMPACQRRRLIPAPMTREQLIHEMERACRTLRRMKFPKNGAPPKVESALGCHLPEPLRDWRQGDWPSDLTRITREPPTMQDIDHHDRWFPLLYKAPEKDRGLVYVRLAYGMGWRRVGSYVGCSHEQARRQFEGAIDIIRLYVVREARRGVTGKDLTLSPFES